MHLPAGREYQFLNFRLLPDQARLLKQGEDIPLSPKTFRFLCVLISAGNAVVSRESLFDILWEGRSVSDESLAQVVAQCRRALGDSASQQRVIKTLHKIGFRLVPEIKSIPKSNGTALANQTETSPQD